MNIQNLEITTFFPVRIPNAISQRNETESNYSIGIDLYMPYASLDFIDALLELNKKKYPGITCTQKQTETIEHTGNSKYLRHIFLIENKVDDSTKIQLMRIEIDETLDGTVFEEVFFIYSDITIPSGVGVLIPENCFGEVRSKSSNFNLNYTVITGTIDMNYTYSMGVQIHKLNRNTVVLMSGQKIAQFLLMEAVPVMKIHHNNLTDFEALESVQKLRNVRTGGFGSTGKF